MVDDINRAIDEYQTKWQVLVDARHNRDFFASLEMTSIGWKMPDLASFDQGYNELRDICDQVFTVWLNERWIATMHLRDTKLTGGIEIIKLMQLRPGSKDAVGLDHIDFYTQEPVEPVLQQETDLHWTYEKNNPLAHWHSVWFANTEAKLRGTTILDICIAELQQTKQKAFGEVNA